MNLQVYNYNSSPITFSLNGEVMVNGSQMAKPFKKLPAHFLSNQQTKDFISALSDRYRNSDTDILQVINGGSNPGTWMHQKLALKFAGWLSPEFELWVYDRIEELLTSGRTELRAMSDDELLSKALQLSTRKLEEAQRRTLLLQEQNEQHVQVIKEQAPKVAYYNQVLDSEEGWSTTVIAQDFGMSAVAFNKKLHALGVLRKVNGVWCITSRHMDKGYTDTRTYPFVNSLGQQRTSISLVWTQRGREFLHRLLKKEGAAD